MRDSGRTQVFSITSEPEQLAILRAWLREQLARQDLPRPDQSGLLVAVGELCTNSIQHAYGGEGGKPIVVSVHAFDDRLVIEVEDFGKPFEPDRYVAPDLDTIPERGMGLYLVREIADLVSFDVRREHGTRWSLVKYRAGRAPDTGNALGTSGDPPSEPPV